MKFKETNMCTYLMETKEVHYSLFSVNSIVHHFYCGQKKKSDMVPTKRMQMLEIFSNQSILEYTCILRETSRHSTQKSKLHMWKILYIEVTSDNLWNQDILTPPIIYWSHYLLKINCVSKSWHCASCVGTFTTTFMCAFTWTLFTALPLPKSFSNSLP